MILLLNQLWSFLAAAAAAKTNDKIMLLIDMQTLQREDFLGWQEQPAKF